MVPGRYVRVVSTMRLLRIRIRGPRCNRFFSSTSATHKDKTHKKAESARCKKRNIIRNVRVSADLAIGLARLVRLAQLTSLECVEQLY